LVARSVDEACDITKGTDVGLTKFELVITHPILNSVRGANLGNIGWVNLLRYVLKRATANNLSPPNDRAKLRGLAVY
jgi:hypothetical protein